MLTLAEAEACIEELRDLMRACGFPLARGFRAVSAGMLEGSQTGNPADRAPGPQHRGPDARLGCHLPLRPAALSSNATAARSNAGVNVRLDVPSDTCPLRQERSKGVHPTSGGPKSPEMKLG